MSYIEKLLWAIPIILILLFALYITRHIYAIYYGRKLKTVLLELTPSYRGDKTLDATSQLFMSLHALGKSVKWYQRIFGIRQSFSLEIVATKAGGIRYIIRCDENLSSTIQHIISSYTSDVKVKLTKDYVNDLLNPKIIEFKQNSHFAYPLQEIIDPFSHDPIGYVTNAMTKLSVDELMAFQLVIKPTRSREAEILNHRIMTNENLMPKLNNVNIPIIGWLAGLASDALFVISDIFSEIVSGGSRERSKANVRETEQKRQVAKGIKPARTLTFFEQEMVQSISNKLSQQLFQANIRVLINAKTEAEYITRRKNIEAALNVYSVPKYQKLSVRKVKYKLLQKYSLYSFKLRTASFFKSSSSLFSVSEVASLYHFPHTISAKTENVVKSLSRTLPAPISLKGTAKLDIILGENVHQGVSTPIGLSSAEREKHMYVIGGTGNGKTTMLLYGIIQDIKSGKGIAVIDPHGDLAETILHHIPENRIKDVIYFNPDDLAHPIGMNLLELPPGLEGDDLLREKDIITESTISVLRKIFSEDDSGGHRIEYVLRNTIQTALTIEGATLFTIFKLLNDSKYRREVTKTLKDEDLKNFWKNEIGKAGDFQRVKMAAGITAKIGRFLFSASAKKILEQEKSTINFDDVLDSGKILICNFSKGLLGEDTSALFGITVLAKLQVASLRRARLQQHSRRPFYIYVDEFQNFATMSFVQMLSESRKYKIFLTMAEQSTAQQDEQRLVDIILANVGTVICFRSGSPADERLVLPLFSPYIEQGEIANLPSYNFYARIAAIHSQEPMSGVTLLLKDNANVDIYNKVIKYSQTYYSIKATDTKGIISTKPKPKAVKKQKERIVSVK